MFEAWYLFPHISLIANHCSVFMLIVVSIKQGITFAVQDPQAHAADRHTNVYHMYFDLSFQ